MWYYLLLFLFSFCLSQGLTWFLDGERLPVVAKTTAPLTVVQGANPRTLVEKGRRLYEQGRFSKAAEVLQQAAEGFNKEGDSLRQGMALSNLALAYKQLGDWSKAQEVISRSLELLQSGSTSNYGKLQGAAFDIQGQIYLAQGQPESAWESFEAATVAYRQAGEQEGLLKSKINQAQALQASGLYRRALETLREVNATLETQPDSQSKAIALRSLGNILRLVGDLNKSQEVLAESLSIAQGLQSPEDMSAALLGLGNTAKAQAKTQEALGNSSEAQAKTQQALDYYQQATDTQLISPTTKIQAQLNLLSLLVDRQKQLTTAAQPLVREIQVQIAKLPASRATADARINFARSLMKLGIEQGGTAQIVAEQLAIAVQQAEEIQDPRVESYALGQLGNLYEKTQQWQEAQKLTEEALIIAQAITAPDIAYSWQWQLGRLLKQQGKRQGAIASYTAAIATLESLRSDLVSVNSDVQFSFRESVEPVYRELVKLLLTSPEGTEPNQKDLETARQVIESLQQAELINFFRENCLNATPVLIDEVDQQAAVIYPIVFQDRLEVVLSLPGAPLRHYTTQLPQEEIENILEELRQQTIGSRATIIPTGTIRGPKRNQPLSPEGLKLAQEVYKWLIEPVEADITASEAKTLVFVLDGPLLNLPMAVLHDGEQFLVEKYAIALTPGLQLLNPKSLERGELSALKGGLSEARQAFSALPNVEKELAQLQLPGELLLNQDFTTPAVQNDIDANPFPIVHLATHGQFSSNLEDTFILTWDDRLNINQLSNLLQAREETGRGAIELLVLSACQTATGDKRAALGLAGVAVKAGARSTLATLWVVDDQATADLMIQFYQELADPTISKAEALRRAQIELLQNPEFQHPIYWAPFVLVGNWL
ncbi:MAG: CHAT domain-containing protein [Symploca sp. SIO2C1]|nr:CHAT domain-containing protein [Symploca sp. SIO2C1]